MRVYFRSQNLDFISIIENCPIVPQKLVTERVEDGERVYEHMVPRLRYEFSKEDKDDAQKDDKVINILFFATDNDMLNIVMSCSSAKQVWEAIEVIYEGTGDVKQNRLQVLIEEYESFNSKSGETLDALFGSFKRLLNDLKLYGKSYSNQDAIAKFMRAFPRVWDPKTIAIEEAKDLKTLTLDELFGSLYTYELELNDKLR